MKRKVKMSILTKTFLEPKFLRFSSETSMSTNLDSNPAS